MNTYLLTAAARIPLRLHHEAADHAIATGACPKCGATSWGVQGTGRRPSADDRARDADGISTCCKQFVGVIRAETDTLFGVLEDEAAVLASRCRVY